MAILEVDKDTMMEIFESKENVKKSVFAVMDNRLTAAHLASDVFVLLEMLDKLEIVLIGEPLVQEVPPAQQPQVPAQPDQAPAQQPQAPTQPEQTPAQQPQAPAQPEQTPVQEQPQESAPAEQPQPEQNQNQGQ